ncbi:cobalt-precorrin 5A hydrolase [Methanococcus maripaludis]|uniref:Cobalt-precorrin 5A hydrolase n=2 Tax=Methanococcus maripaludis TaxID=39152 RepID=A0A7J9PEL8_METMI|nr:cobalamin biosynthesis protein [Methanococcus maripaludis]MBA2861561.1 cobalt-precorrin 5A hydrolase [Methanococcus maripaludis]
MIKIVYITENAKKLANDVKSVFDYYFYDNEVFNIKDFEITGNETGFIFIMASGIVLRKYITEIQNDKLKDPFVILMDESKKYVVPLLSNHIGGGNYFSDLIGNSLNLNVVKTTATDVNGKIGIDELSKIYFLENPLKKDILLINKKVLSEKPDLIIPKSWKASKKLLNSYNVSFHNENYVSVDDILLEPKTVSLGLGSRKNIETNKVYWAVKKALYLRDIPTWRIDSFSTVSIKKDESGILKTAERFGKSLFIFEIDEINEIYSKMSLNRSDFVFKTIGTYGVCEPCAILGILKLTGETNFEMKNIVLNKMKKDGVSVSIAVK